MARPDKLPTWATSGSAKVVEPTSDKKAIGLVNLEKPAAGIFNWLLKKIIEWIAYFDESGVAGYFGDGSDGALAFDGANAVAGCSRSGSVYTATRDLHASSAVLSSSVQVKMAGFAFYCTGLLDMTASNCIISNDGNAASGTTGGAAAANKFGTSAGTVGTDGVVGPSAGNNAGSNVLNGLGAIGGTGGSSGSGQAGGSQAAVGAPSNWRAGLSFVLGYFFSSKGIIYLHGGGGGSTGGAAGGGTSGAGGGGGGLLIVAARGLAVSASALIRAIGGNGSNAGGGNAGGGGGGGGGGVLLTYRENAGSVDPTTRVSVAGGGGGAGTGTGAVGNSGTTGQKFVRLV